jgi:hypothetical protein
LGECLKNWGNGPLGDGEAEKTAMLKAAHHRKIFLKDLDIKTPL